MSAAIQSEIIAPSTGRNMSSKDVSISESALIEKSRNGDRDAFAGIISLYENAVYQLAWRILKRREDAEDATQETFLRAWRSLSSFDVKRPFRPWLLRIAANAALSAIQNRQDDAMIRNAADVDLIPEASSLAPDEKAIRREMLDAVNAVTGDLPPESAALFQLRFGQELPIDEIALILNKKPGTVAVALHRLRERLRRVVLGAKGESEI